MPDFRCGVAQDDTTASDRDAAACNDTTSTQSRDREALEISATVLTAVMVSMTHAMICRET